MAAYLTERQKEILDFILRHQRSRGVAPTHREICERFVFVERGRISLHPDFDALRQDPGVAAYLGELLPRKEPA